MLDLYQGTIKCGVSVNIRSCFVVMCSLFVSWINVGCKERLGAVEFK